jgi:hypothetical protein
MNYFASAQDFMTGDSILISTALDRNIWSCSEKQPTRMTQGLSRAV